MKKTTTEMRKRTEANARRRVAESWARTGKCMSYKRAAVRETYRHTTDDMNLTSSLKKHAFYNLLINNILYLCIT